VQVDPRQQIFPSIRAAFAHTLAVRVLGFILGIGNSILVARSLGADGRGHLSLLLSAAMFLSLIFGLFTSSNTILLGREPWKLRTLICHSFIGALLSLLVLWGLYESLPRHLIALVLGNVPDLWMNLLFGILGFQVLAGSLNGLLLAQQEFYFINYVSVINGASILVLNALFIIWLGLSVTGALLVFMISWTGVSVISFWRLRQSRAWSAGLMTFSLSSFWEGLAIGARAIMSNLPALLMLRSDVFLVQYFLGAAPVGIYTVAVNVAEMVLIVGGALNTIAFAKAASEQGNDDGVIRSAQFSLIISLGFWLFLGVSGWWLFPLAYGEEFKASYTLSLIVMCGICAWGFCAPLVGYIVGRAGYPASYIGATSVGFIINLLLNLVMIPRYGIVGAALTTAITYTLTGLIVLWIFAKMTQRNVKRILIPDRADLHWIRQGYLLLKKLYLALG
jgi:O-antigen/teichoic acid export membrane protein